MTAALLAGGGFFLSDRMLSIGLFGLAGILSIAGIVIARRDDDPDAAGDV